MSEIDEPIYAAPKTHVPARTVRRPILRFWPTCLICSVLVPAAGIVLISHEIPALGMTFFLLACWLIPVGWIVFPELRHGGLSNLSCGRALAISAGFFAATTAIAFALMVIASLAYWLVEVSRYGT
ncbi:MAG: hypothetical protein ACREP4_12870 [Stenotrophomonas sp.]|uniref:hypothetical protein n=1 Tax=Stenotrophomonas sp. TaxID=69392 RepID=UPI003D6CE619